MALHNLRITVVDGGSDSSEKGVGKKKEKKEKTGLEKALNYNQTIKEKFKSSTSPMTFFAVQSAVNVASQVARSTANYFMSDIGRKHGDSNYQAQVNRKIEVVTDIAGFGTAAISGAASGAVFGGAAGAAVGAAVGAVSHGVSLGFRQAGRERAYQHEIFKDNMSQQYNLARTSYQGFTGRVR